MEHFSTEVIENSPSEASIAQKSITGSSFSIASSAVTIVLGFARAILLARLLVPEDFGVFTLASFFMVLLGKPKDFGFSAALVHRDSHNEEDIAAHFILRVAPAVLIFMVAFVASPVLLRFYPNQPLMPPVMVALTGIEVLKAVNSTPQVLLSKHLEFKRIAMLDVGSSIAALVVAVSMAWAGAGVWSLVGEIASGAVIRFLGLWLYRPPWSLNLRTRWPVIKWFLRFGWFTFLSSNLSFLLDRFDDFWTGTALGSTALGFYSKAYEFARYPRRVVANPVARVFFSTFAKLQHDRERLSKAFFRVCSLVVRVGFLFAGIFALVTPEFIHLLLGDKWLPMAFTFQLMLIYTLFDPLLVLSSKLTTAVGEPQALTKVKFVQLIFFVPTVIVLAHFFGIDGVAVAADLMLAMGIVVILPRVRRYVDFSLWRMVGYPTLALAVGLALGWYTVHVLNIQNLWLSLVVKIAVAATPYAMILWLFERQLYTQTIHLILSLLAGQREVSKQARS